MIKQYRSKEWLQNKYINEKLSSRQIAKLCGVAHSVIQYWFKKYNIPIRSYKESIDLAYKNHCDLSQKAINWIEGELLGDGCLLSESYRTANFRYASKYLEYASYIKDTLKSFGIEGGKIYKRYHKDSNCYSYSYASFRYPELLPIRKQWYPEGKKIVPKDIKLTPLVVRQWYIGDGCLNCSKKHNPYISLATNGFNAIDINWLVEKLNKLKFKAKKHLNNTIYISTYSTKAFIDYIGKSPIRCYDYKFNY